MKTLLSVASGFTVSNRPPTRFRASRTATSAPLAFNAVAARRPDSPAPIIATSRDIGPDSAARARGDVPMAPAAAAARLTNLRRPSCTVICSPPLKEDWTCDHEPARFVVKEDSTNSIPTALEFQTGE